MKAKNRILPGLIVVCLILGGLLIGKRAFSVERADENDAGYQKTMEHLSVIAKEVHPSQTLAIEQVRQYLRDELDKVGCEYVEEAFDYKGQLSKKHDPKREYTNILVTLDVPKTTDAVMLVSHYDSTPTGPGAGDDGISVASMLVALERSMDAYRKGTLKNDMYFLFTDGEEKRLLGAKYFVKNHGEMKDTIKLVANFEARGNDGPLLMFQTTPNNNRLLGELKRAVSHLDAFSIATKIYATMPNDTDLTLFLDSGYNACMDFAMIGGGQTYHQMTDNVENINRDSAYRYYRTITEVAEYFGNSDLNHLTDDKDGVFFPVLGGSIFLLSSTAAKTIMSILTVLALLWLVFLVVKKELNGVELLKAAALFAAGLIVAALAGMGYGRATRAFVGAGDATGGAAGYFGIVNGIQVVLITLLVTAIAMWFSKKKSRAQGNLVFAMLLCVAGGMALMVWFDSLIYLFLVPLAILLLLSVASYVTRNHVQAAAAVRMLGTIFMIVAMSVILYPLMKVVLDALGNGFMLYYALLEAFGIYLVNVCFFGNVATPSGLEK